MKKEKRQYNNDYPSVTQVLDVLRKPGLEMWFKWNTPEFIKAESEKAKTIGTTLHDAIQSHIEDTNEEIKTEYPDEVTNALKSFYIFKKNNPQIKLQKSEIQMTSKKYKFNGTMDVIGNLGDVLLAGDWKTSKAKEKEQPDIYPEYLYQVSAYVYLWNELNKEKIAQAFIVAIAKDKMAYNFQLISKKEIDENFKNIFLPSLKIWRFQHG